MYNKISKVNAIKLTADQIKGALISQWKLADNSIVRTYQFKNFEDTWGFLTKIAMRSHLIGHHPTITNTYNVVKIELSTHDIGGVSDIDVKLAKRFDDYFEMFKKQ